MAGPMLPTHPDDTIIGQAYDARLMKRMLNYLKPYKLQLALAVALLLAGTGVELVSPLIVKHGIDNYVAVKRISGLGWVALLLTGALVLGVVLRFFQVYLTSWIGERVVQNLRVQLFDHLQRLPLGLLDSRPIGWWMTRVTNDVQTLNEMFSTVVVSVFGDLLALAGIVTVLLILNWKLALVTFTVLPLLIWAVTLFRSRVRRTFRIIREALAKLNGFMQEHISGVRTVQVFNRIDTSFEQFKIHNADFRSAYIQAIRYYALFFPVVTFLLALSTALILLTGGKMILGAALTWGGLVAFLQYAERFFRPIRDLAERYNTMQAAMAAAERVFWLLDSKQESRLPTDDRGRVAAAMQTQGEIIFDHLEFAYKTGETVLKDVSFTVEPGTTVAIVGATGAGKTTLISLLLRFWELNEGRILLDGKDIGKWNLSELRQAFGVVLQDTFLFSGSIAENVTLGELSRGGEVLQRALTEANAMSFVERLPNFIDEPVGERGAQISVGERQLLAIARAIAASPSVMLLDEATAAIDTETEIKIQSALERLMRGRTTLVIAHRLSTIRKADKIVVLHKGRVRETGTHAQLLALDGIYARLYRLQFASAAA
ncbi:MAG: ABC transporter ATP-binding protein [Calditrichaeota bacterium]|nr:ABC transporter ATP-binding protein [Calditrichota bacterium]